MKIMRAPKQVRYVIHELPEVPEVLSFLVRRADMSPAEAYATLNMGVGFIAIVSANDADVAIQAAKITGYKALNADEVVLGPRSLTVPHLSIEFTDQDIQLG